LAYRFTIVANAERAVERYEHLFVGIDLGTSGVRTMAVSETGHVAARVSMSLAAATVVQEHGLHEQQPEAWWEAVCEASSALMAQLRAKGIPPDTLTALAVDGTSGTLVCVDQAGSPVRPGIMYNDSRAAVEAEELNAPAGDFCQRMGYRFKSSFALPKIAWVRKHERERFNRTAHLMHQADYIVARLTGEFNVSDYSNALKTGYDLIEGCWPSWLGHIGGVMQRLPRVVAPGTVVGKVSSSASERTGLPCGLPVVAGASDGTAACIASGIRNPGDYNTTLGTTLVFKGVSRRPCSHPDGIVYSHKLPGGLWLPGAAGNTGCEWITKYFPGQDLARLDAAAAERLPNRHIAYPLVRRGERFPFLCDTTEGFCLPAPADETDRYAAYLQGVAFVERLSYELLDEVMGASGGEVFSTGGGSVSDVWMQCRADATGRTIHRPASPESAFGSAVLAAAGTVHSDLRTATREMANVERTFAPLAETADSYCRLYREFCAELENRGYLQRTKAG